MALLWVILLLWIALLVYIGYKHVYAPHQVFRRIGIDGPKPTPLLGNVALIKRLGRKKFREYLIKEYGPVVGYYVLNMPFLLVTDVDMLKQILVKDMFIDRPYVPSLDRPAHEPKGLLNAQGDEWRRARHTLSPAFSSAKLKAMTPLFQRSLKTLFEVFGNCADSPDSVDISVIFGRYTLESTLSAIFGRKVEILRGENDDLSTACTRYFTLTDQDTMLPFIYVYPIFYSVPWIEPILRFMVSFSEVKKHSDVIMSTAEMLIAQRKQDPNSHKYKDLLQLLIIASTKSADSEGLSDDEVKAHAATMLMTGYETTQNGLAYVAYMLALNPDIQERLQQEIDSYFEENPDSDPYTAAQGIEYLEKVIFESLRHYGPGEDLIQYCRKTVVINGVTIPEGVTVSAPLIPIHEDPNHWENPDVYDPERFSPEEKAKRPPCVFMPFGYGPRRCIGMMFALLQIKLVLSQLLRKFTFVQSPETEVPLKRRFGLTVRPANGIWVKITRRN